MAQDNYQGDMSFIYNDKVVEELEKLYKKAVKERRNWIEYDNKRISTNFIYYVLKYSGKLW